MDSNIIAAIIGSVGAILAAIFGGYVKKFSESSRRRSMGYPDIRGKWQATWYVDGDDNHYNITTVDITKLKGFQIYGAEIDPNKTYKIHGNFSRNHIINLIYESDDPSVILSGVVTLKIEPMGKTGKGFWSGYTKEDQILAGKVIWERKT